MNARRMTSWGVVSMALLAGSLPTGLGGQEVRGSAFLETRVFPRSPAFTGQRESTVSPSIGIAPEFLWENGSGNLQFTFAPFVRLDTHDGSRSHADIREASGLYFGTGWTLYAGLGKVFWGKTEAHHLVDVINQTDQVEDVDTEDKLGQPMVNLTIERDWGAVDLFYLPYFRERTYAGDRGRLRGPLPVGDAVTYESDAERWHPGVAGRWSLYVGGLDFALSAFRGTSREPNLSPATVGTGMELRPRYAIIDQVSVDLQWTRGATLWKLEAMTRGGHGDRFGAMVAGVEHTLFSLGSGLTDLGLIGEVMLDGRDATAPFTAFDNDVFVGARWAFNDDADTSILGGPVLDYETGEAIVFLEAERRIGDRWVGQLEGRWFLGTDDAAGLAAFRRDGFFTFRISRYF